jgi:hypothetical protein
MSRLGTRHYRSRRLRTRVRFLTNRFHCLRSSLLGMAMCRTVAGLKVGADNWVCSVLIASVRPRAAVRPLRMVSSLSGDPARAATNRVWETLAALSGVSAVGTELTLGCISPVADLGRQESPDLHGSGQSQQAPRSIPAGSDDAQLRGGSHTVAGYRESGLTAEFADAPLLGLAARRRSFSLPPPGPRWSEMTVTEPSHIPPTASAGSGPVPRGHSSRAHTTGCDEDGRWQSG